MANANGYPTSYIHQNPSEHWRDYATFKGQIDTRRQAVWKNLMAAHAQQEKQLIQSLGNILKAQKLIRDINNILRKQNTGETSIAGFTDALRGIFDKKTATGRENSYHKLQKLIAEAQKAVSAASSVGIAPNAKAAAYLAALQPNGVLDKQLSAIIAAKDSYDAAAQGEQAAAKFLEALKPYRTKDGDTTIETAKNILRGIINSVEGGAAEKALKQLLERKIRKDSRIHVDRTGTENTDTGTDAKKSDVTVSVTINGEKLILGIQVKNWNFGENENSTTGKVWTRSVGRRVQYFSQAVNNAELTFSSVVNYLVGDFGGWDSKDDEVLNYIALRNFDEFIGGDVNVIAFKNRFLWVSQFLWKDGQHLKLAPKLDTRINTLNAWVGEADVKDVANALTRSNRVYNAFKNAGANMY